MFMVYAFIMIMNMMFGSSSNGQYNVSSSQANSIQSSRMFNSIENMNSGVINFEQNGNGVIVVVDVNEF